MDIEAYSDPIRSIGEMEINIGLLTPEDILNLEIVFSSYDPDLSTETEKVLSGKKVILGFGLSNQYTINLNPGTDEKLIAPSGYTTIQGTIPTLGIRTSLYFKVDLDNDRIENIYKAPLSDILDSVLESAMSKMLLEIALNISGYNSGLSAVYFEFEILANVDPSNLGALQMQVTLYHTRGRQQGNVPEAKCKQQQRLLSTSRLSAGPSSRPSTQCLAVRHALARLRQRARHTRLRPCNAEGGNGASLLPHRRDSKDGSTLKPI